jgi:AraC-like DNA-binding protein
MRPNASTEVADRAVERRRAVSLDRHYREAEGLSIAQIAERLGRSPATIEAYFYDPTGEKARAVKARYQGSSCERTAARGTIRVSPSIVVGSKPWR